jgi:hypothetical protein
MQHLGTCLAEGLPFWHTRIGGSAHIASGSADSLPCAETTSQADDCFHAPQVAGPHDRNGDGRVPGLLDDARVLCGAIASRWRCGQNRHSAGRAVAGPGGSADRQRGCGSPTDCERPVLGRGNRDTTAPRRSGAELWVEPTRVGSSRAPCNSTRAQGGVAAIETTRTWFTETCFSDPSGISRAGSAHQLCARIAGPSRPRDDRFSRRIAANHTIGLATRRSPDGESREPIATGPAMGSRFSSRTTQSGSRHDRGRNSSRSSGTYLPSGLGSRDERLG